MNNTFEQRLRAVEDREAIRALKAYYARCADEKYTDDHERRPQAEIDVIARRQVEATFTADAVWDGGPQFGRREGREAIYDHLRAGGWNFALHYFVSPVITVEGDRAQGSWMLWQPCTLTAGNRSMLMSATTEDDYVRTAEGWRMTFMRFTLKFITPLERPWSVNRNAVFTG
jgi:SnoaL-like protein